MILQQNGAGEGGSVALPNLVNLHQIDINEIERYGGKGIGLARLAQNGVNIPPGAVLDTSVHAAFNETGCLAEEVIDAVMTTIRQLGGRVALRSSATVEDSEEASMAGVFDTHYVTSPEREKVRTLLEDMYGQASSPEAQQSVSLFGAANGARLAVVVQTLVDRPTHAGVIYASSDHPSTTMQYVDGYGARLVDGATSGTSLLVDRTSGQITASSGYDRNPLSGDLLANLLDQLDLVTGLSEGYRDVEFAIDPNGQVHILQDRPLPKADIVAPSERTIVELSDDAKERANRIMLAEMQRLGTERSILTMANFSELLPRPTAMDVGVFSYIFPGYNGQPGAIQIGRQQMGYPLGDASVGYMHYIGGRVYESLAGDAATYYAGFPGTEEEYIQTMVGGYLDTAHADPNRAHYPEMGLYLQDPTLQDLSDIFGTERAPDLLNIYDHFQSGMGELAEDFLHDFEHTQRGQLEQFILQKSDEQLSELSDQQLLSSLFTVLEHMRLESCVAFVKAARLGFYYTQRSQVLLSEALGLQDDELLTAMSHLSQGLSGSQITDINLAIADAESEAEAVALAQRLAAHYPAEGEALQLRRPRFSDSPDSVRQYVAGIRSGQNYRQAYEHQKAERKQVQQELLGSVDPSIRQELETSIANMQRYMAMRETVKNIFTQEYALLREHLTVIGARAGLEGNAIFHLYPHELATLLQAPSTLHHLTRARSAEFSKLGELVMPRILTEATIDQIGSEADNDSPFRQAQGSLIAPGESFQGTVVNLEEFADLEEAREVIDRLLREGHRIILAAQQVNLTHDPYIHVAGGLILQNAGFVSHGAQRAREMGVGALSGIAINRLHTGLQVRFDPQNKLVSSLEESNSRN